jgi:hypothetical protein
MEKLISVIDYWDWHSEVKEITQHSEKDIVFIFTMIVNDVELSNIEAEIKEWKSAKDILGYYQWK